MELLSQVLVQILRDVPFLPTQNGDGVEVFKKTSRKLYWEELKAK